MTASETVSLSLLTPLKWLERSAGLFPHKAAIVHGERRYTYTEFGQRVRRLAWALKNAGLHKGDRVAFLCPNIPPMLEAHWGVPLAGGLLVSINVRLAPPEIAYILDHSGARFLFVDTELAPLVEPIAAERKQLERIIRIEDIDLPCQLGDTDYERFLETGSNAAFPCPIDDENDELAINYTSGTTGRPKGVLYTHRGACLNAMGEIIETGLTADSVYLWTLPMFHCNGWCFTWAVAGIGATNVCLRKFDPATCWDLINREKVTHFCGAPVVMMTLANHPGRPATLETPITATVAGAPPSPTLIQNVTEMGARIIHVYGLTETYGPHTINVEQKEWKERGADAAFRLRARQGVGYLATDAVRVVDDAMNDTPRDGQTLGEVVMRGNNVMKGYFQDADATAKAFRGGWFHSGDLAVMHPDGYIELKDRGKDIIITGGENVSSIEVEQALYRHPAVLEVAVIGVPHPKWGETPKAFVTLKPDKTATPEELIAFCRQHLAGFKCPTSIEFTPLPKTSTGKIQKFVLRSKEWQGHDTMIKGA